jgi:hypothetical protein
MKKIKSRNAVLGALFAVIGLSPVSFGLPAMANFSQTPDPAPAPNPPPPPSSGGSGTNTNQYTSTSNNAPVANSQSGVSATYAGGNSNTFITGGSGDNRSVFATCSFGESSLGAFATGSFSGVNGKGDYGNNSSFNGSLGLYASIPLNGGSKQLCKRITSTFDSFAILRACVDIGGQAIKYNPYFRFTEAMFFGLAQHGIDTKVVVACNAMLPQTVVHHQPPVQVLPPAVQPPVYMPHNPTVPARN